MAAALGLILATKTVDALWLHGYLGAVVYGAFWVLAVLCLRPRLPMGTALLGVALALLGVEVMQLWHPPLLEQARATFLGSALLGSSFSVWDLPCYACGCLLGCAAAERPVRA